MRPTGTGSFEGIAYDFEARAGRIVLTPGHYCDRVSVVRLFRAIDPEARQIEIYFADGKQRVRYVRHDHSRAKNGTWRGQAAWQEGVLRP